MGEKEQLFRKKTMERISSPEQLTDYLRVTNPGSIYAGGFANCAATVEDGSWCDTNDACHSRTVKYQGMNDCTKAWR